MKKIFPLFLILLIACQFSSGQFKQIAEGPTFTEPEDGFAKIIQLKNGNTFYTSVFFTSGINIRIYDANHIEKVVTNISPTFKISKFEDIESIFEINNNVILFISEQVDHTPVLYKLTIDGSTGKLLNETQVAKLHKSGILINPGGANNMVIINREDQLRYFSIKKDPYSDNYAVACFDIETREKDKRIEIIHYNGQHHEISRTYCSPGNGNFYLFMDMVVIGSEKVYVFLFESKGTYGFTYKGKNVMGSIEQGSAKVNYIDLDFDNDIYVYSGIAAFDPALQKIIYLILVRKSRGSTQLLSYTHLVDLANNKNQSLKQTGLDEKLNTLYKEKFGKEPDFFPQDIFLNDKGGFTVVYEEHAITNITESGRLSNTIDTKLGSVMVVKYDGDGNLLSNYVMPKYHWVLDQQLYPFYHSRFRNAAPFLYNGSYYTNTGNHYKSFAYIDGIQKQYILFNDTERNSEISKKIVVVNKTNECDAFMYTLTGDDIFPKREYVLENTHGTKFHSVLWFTVSEYDKKSNIFITLRHDQYNDKNKTLKLVWLQPQ